MTAYALHIGINYCNAFDFAECELDGAVGDARAFAEFTRARGVQSLLEDRDLLLDEAATKRGIVNALSLVPAKVTKDDSLLVTFCGFGAPPDFAEALAQDNRAWVTNDLRWLRILDVRDLLLRAATGARILMVSVACFTGPEVGVPLQPEGSVRLRRLRALSDRFAARIQSTRNDENDLDGLVAARKAKTLAAATKPAVIHLSASALNQVIPDGSTNVRSPFTTAALALLNGSQPRTFEQFRADLAKSLPADAQPQLEFFGFRDVDFEALGPFGVTVSPMDDGKAA